MSKKTKLNAYILLDRSGSMNTRWEETLSSVNTYAEQLGKDTKAEITLATFDSDAVLHFDVIRDSVDAKKWKKVTNDDASPRGMTPLFDAIGKIVPMAEKADNKKTVIVVMTDGQENNSREVKKADAKAALDRCKAKGWQVVFLGADFDAFGEAANVGVSFSSTLNMTAGNYMRSMVNLASHTSSYACTGESIMFSAKDRKEASKEKSST